MTDRPAPTGRFALLVDDGGQTRRFALPDGRSLVGRAKDCHIVIDHTSVSRVHAALVVSGDAITLVDLRSRNRTLLNGDPIEEASVAPDDVVTFGSVLATVRLAGEETTGLVKPTAVRPLGFPDANSTSSIDAPRLIRLLSEVGRALVGTLSLEEILSRVIDLLFANVRAERVCVLMTDRATGALTPAVARRADGGDVDGPMTSQTAIDTAVEQRLAIMAIDARIDRRFGGAESIQVSHISSLMCAPLFSGERLMGALYADSGRANEFSEGDLELFTSLANYAAVAIAQATLADQLAEERRRRERLQRYHSPAVVDRILAHQIDDALLAAEEREISVLFADIVEFTTMAESMRPAEVAALLNVFLARTADAIFAEQGTIDKFLGDAILAVFGAPLEQPDHALRAVRAAQAMRRIVAAMNAEGTFPALRVRYAINSGMAIAGDIGPAKQAGYTVLGDVVNIGARLKSAAAPDQVVVSRATYDRLGTSIPATVLGEFTVRGRQGKVEVPIHRPIGPPTRDGAGGTRMPLSIERRMMSADISQIGPAISFALSSTWSSAFTKQSISDFGGDQGRRAVEHIAVVARGLRHHAVMLHQRHDDALCRRSRRPCRTPASRPSSAASVRGSPKRTRDERPLPADLGDELVPLLQLRQPFQQQRAHPRRILDQSPSSSSTCSVASPATMARLLASNVEKWIAQLSMLSTDLLEDAAPHQRGADRHEAAAQRLRQADHVGLEIPVLGGQELARAAEAGLHLVEHEQRAVEPAQLLRARQVLVAAARRSRPRPGSARR